ncbi:methylated-DNA--[protein]-cysteine S-methyltransferase [Demequina sp. NBRC 110056]|uniref:methylated-DNA--[protein]-cysteine S-methyltransferase n=1 Tax=Demequina sp. NBRC 110056 TaxID=1570345 RepID=UPI000A00CC82|nr:methylated-DNA--[protein]-cysteine S-methyltransferase [Demequina sp. NBRC 110056]
MLTHQTLDTPDGPFTVVERDGNVVAAAWSADPAEVAARAGLAGSVDGTVQAADAVAAYYAGDASAPGRVPVEARGTAFRERVWEALRAIPAGETRTYGEVAQELGSPGASRAVGGACGANPIALFVPCHRVHGASGALTGFAWGVDVKRSLLARESA